MSFFDILIAIVLGYAFIKGIKNGLFIEIASFVSLILGIYFAIHFSKFIEYLLVGIVHWSPNTIRIFAFLFAFILIVFGIQFLGKILTKIADFAYLGWINKAGGGFFRVLKTILVLSIFFMALAKINYNNFLVSKTTLDQSLFYNPIEKTGKIIFPSLEEFYKKHKSKNQKNQ